MSEPISMVISARCQSCGEIGPIIVADHLHHRNVPIAVNVGALWACAFCGTPHLFVSENCSCGGEPRICVRPATTQEIGDLTAEGRRELARIQKEAPARRAAIARN